MPLAPSRLETSRSIAQPPSTDAKPRAWRVIERGAPADDPADQHARGRRWQLPGAARWMLFLLLAEAAAIYGAVVMNTRAIVLAAAVAMVAVLGFLLPWISVLGLRAVLHVNDRRGQVGRPARLGLRLRSFWPWPLAALSIEPDAVRGESNPGGEASLAIGLLPPWRWCDIRWSFTPTRRGLFPQGSPRVSCGFPFGFWQARREIACQGRMLVWPEVVTLPAMRRSIASGRALEDVLDSRRTGTSGELTGARPHRPGESLRRIHWPQTARHNRLIVSERSATGGRSMLLVVETDRAIHDEQDGASTLEKALSVAASMTSALLAEGVDAALVFDRGPIVSGMKGIAAILDGLARHEDEAGASLAELFAAPGVREAAQSAALLIVTTPKGWRRHGAEARDARVVLVELSPDANPPGPEPASRVKQDSDVTIVPVNDAQHQALQAAWRKAAQTWMP
ncbi:MAG: DUF58 domain-containing protein [Pirellulaceae bacterium]